jgi:hypothetical protein
MAFFGCPTLTKRLKELRVMFRRIKRYFAIRSYVMRLSQELARRFDRSAFYSVEQVQKAVERGGFSAAFIAYAHAAFCGC